MLIDSTIALCIGFALDLVVGDPQGWPHVVRLYGLMINRLEKALYPMKNKRLCGALLAVILLAIVAAACSLLWALHRVSPIAYIAIESLLCWQVLATKSLKDESGKVYTALKTEGLPAARHAVSMIVGRDTDALDAAGVARATVETVAENASDGMIAPLFFLMLGGAPLGLLYKAVNTMDSMIGYKNERYLDFGRFAAKLDDAVNYIPARLSAVLMIAAAYLCRMDAKNAFRIWRRDRRNHKSPNSAQTESVMAGALDIRLAGDAVYFGKTLKKPYIGDDIRPIEPEDILRSHRLLYATAILMFALVLVVRGCGIYAL